MKVLFFTLVLWSPADQFINDLRGFLNLWVPSGQVKWKIVFSSKFSLQFALKYVSSRKRQIGNSKWGTANVPDQLEGRWETASRKRQIGNGKCGTAKVSNGKYSLSKRVKRQMCKQQIKQTEFVYNGKCTPANVPTANELTANVVNCKCSNGKWWPANE